MPAANAIWGGDHIVRYTGVDLSVAVAVDGGLLTPVLRGVDRMSLVEVSAGVAELAERARAGRLQQRELEDGRLAVGTVMTVTLSADHRIIDGAVAAEWMAAFVRRIENPVSALL